MISLIHLLPKQHHDSVFKDGRALLPKTLELEGQCVLNDVNGFTCSLNAGTLCKFSIIEVGIPYG